MSAFEQGKLYRLRLARAPDYACDTDWVHGHLKERIELCRKGTFMFIEKITEQIGNSERVLHYKFLAGKELVVFTISPHGRVEFITNMRPLEEWLVYEKA